MKKARKHKSKILDELFIPFEKMTDKEKIDYLQTENKMLKMALDEADKINLLNKGAVSGSLQIEYCYKCKPDNVHNGLIPVALCKKCNGR